MNDPDSHTYYCLYLNTDSFILQGKRLPGDRKVCVGFVEVDGAKENPFPKAIVDLKHLMQGLIG